MASLHIAQGLFDIIYPIGSYYETSNASFNPNTDEHWYGTWKEDTVGRVLVAYNTGTFKTVGTTGGSETNTHNHFKAGDGGTVSTAANGPGSFVIGNKNNVSSETINILQPYVVVKRWHRTA